MTVVRAVLIIPIILFVTGCSTRTVPFTGRTQSYSVSDQKLNANAAMTYRSFLQNSTPCSDPVINDKVMTIGTSLINALENYFYEIGEEVRLLEFDWEFSVIADLTIQAWCMPGGKIAIHTGLLSLFESNDNCLAVLLGHEMAHALAHHTAESMTDANMVNAITGAMMAAGNPTSHNMAQIYNDFAAIGLLRPHSRYQESEADHIGLIIMSMAGYDPRSAVHVWRTMGKVNKKNSATFLSTHPSHEDRMLQLEALVPTVMPIYNKARKLK